MYKLSDWLDIDKIGWFCLSKNINAINILEKNQNNIYWEALSSNPSAISLLEKNKDNILKCFIRKSKCNTFI